MSRKESLGLDTSLEVSLSENVEASSNNNKSKESSPPPLLPYEVRTSPQFGRYLIASRDLEKREVIIAEEPLIQGPTDESDDILLCLGCCIKLTENRYSRCSKCRFPLCGPSCEQAQIHATNECILFQRNHVPFPTPHVRHVLNKSIIILRGLLLKQRNPPKWADLMTMADNKDTRRNRPNCITADERVLENMKKFLGKDELDKGTYTTEEVLKISGILDVNAHCVPSKVNGKIVASKCHLYLKTSLIAHSCSPNSSWASEKRESKSKLVVRMNTAIRKGEIITVAYDDSDLLHGTLRRLLPMEMSGMFICKCRRCLDPTELGTYLSAVKCQRCPEGYLLPLVPTDSFSDWKCGVCSNTLDEEVVADIVDDAERDVGFPKVDVLQDPEDAEQLGLLKDFIEEFKGKVFHPNHYIIQEINLRILRVECDYIEKLSDDDLNSCLRRCEDLLEIVEVLIPGFGEYRAFIQFQYFRCLLELQERINVKDNLPSSTSLSIPAYISRYKLILGLQQEVLSFLREKFNSSSKIDYIVESMKFVEEEIYELEKVEKADGNGSVIYKQKGTSDFAITA